jgi:hypothetical protein
MVKDELNKECLTLVTWWNNVMHYASGAQVPGVRSPEWLNFDGGAQYLWGHSVELHSWHSSRA